jgi:signal transduction histidine kinase
MFKSARIKLTAWYLTIIMFISISFSAFVFVGVQRDVQRALDAQKKRMERQFFEMKILNRFPRIVAVIDTETLMEIRNRTLANLILINMLILGSAGMLGYFLAGKTLEPIEQMVKKQKRFISDAAHEIKTPLTTMKTELEVTLRDKSLTVEESKKILRSTIEEVDALHNFTNRLLQRSKHQNGSTGLMDNLQLDEVISNSAKKMQSLAKQKSIVINTDAQPTQIKGSAESLSELFTNLIENAIKYSKPNAVINVSLKKFQNDAVVEIEDFGIGISQEDLPFVFDPFYRADKSRTQSQHAGYGLGLAIAKDIAEQHNGTIGVQSTPNVGSKFTVTLPLSNFSA